MARVPSLVVRRLVAGASLSAGTEKRFAGYRTMGPASASGHVLVLRRFSVSSIGLDCASM